MSYNASWQGVVMMALPRLDVRTFAVVPPHVARVLRGLAPQAADAVTAAGATGGEPSHDGIVRTVRHFCDLIEDSRVIVWERVAGAYVETGRKMASEGRGLEEAQQLLLRSARAVWRTMDGLVEGEIGQEAFKLLADAQFSFLDAVSGALVQGHRSQSPDGTAQRRWLRRQLLDRLLADQPADRETLAPLARQARWRLPRTVAAVAVHPRAEHQSRALMLPDELLADPAGPGQRMMLPDPDGPGRTRVLEPLLRDWILAVGPAMRLDQAARSLAWARDTLALVHRGVIGDTGLIRSIDHLSTLVIFRSQSIIETAAVDRLAPMRGLSESQRHRVSETLLALLEHNFNATEASASLHVHPQTVRYRLREIEKLFGAELQDRRARLEIQMILHARLARAGSGGSLHRASPRPAYRTAVAVTARHPAVKPGHRRENVS